jgi:hypothetical protein
VRDGVADKRAPTAAGGAGACAFAAFAGRGELASVLAASDGAVDVKFTPNSKIRLRKAAKAARLEQRNKGNPRFPRVRRTSIPWYFLP